MSDLHTIRITAELLESDGSVAARQLTEYFNLDADDEIFIEKHYINMFNSMNKEIEDKLQEKSKFKGR